MTIEPNQPKGAAELRRQAEEVILGKAAQSPEHNDPLSPEEIRGLLYELGVHQIELEMQNETLRQAQAELIGERERYFELYELAPVGYVTLDENGLIDEANLTVARLLDLTRRELNNKPPVSRFILSADQNIYYRHRKQLLDTGAPQECDLRMLRKDGTAFWARLNATAAEDADGAPMCRVIISDISESKRAQDELRYLEQKMQQTQKLESLGVMAGGIAHDFNNLLFAILGNADFALMEMPSGAVGRDNLQEIQAAAKRAAGLTNQMLAYSGKGALAIDEMDLSELVREMASLLKISHTKKTMVKYRLEENLSAIEGDASQLRQVVMNLITNASEAVGDESGIITVETGVIEATPEFLATTYAHDELPGGRYVYLKVADTGRGMDEATQVRIFEPFFTTKFTGRGLGMAAVLGIVRAHRGAIDIQSEVDQGTTIKVLFPALDEPVRRSVKEESPEEGWTVHGTVLVVDDEPQVRNLLKIVLEHKGFTVLTAEDGLQATKVFRDYKDDIVCVLLDLTMPNMGGEETFVELHQIRADVPVLLLSGYSEIEIKERFENLGFAGFLKKPVGSREILEKVRAVLKS